MENEARETEITSDIGLYNSIVTACSNNDKCIECPMCEVCYKIFKEV